MSDDFKKEFNDYYHPGGDEKHLAWLIARTKNDHERWLGVIRRQEKTNKYLRWTLICLLISLIAQVVKIVSAK